MGSEHNRIRKKWQNYSGSKATLAELSFFEILTQLFIGTDYQIKSKPKEFENIYVNISLAENDLLQIHNPEAKIKKHGIVPDYVIENKNSGKKIYIEVKRQDGWIEGGKRADGRGNAHERSCKFFTPGLLHILQNASGIKPPNLPFWTVFQGDITRDPCRVREITCWYDKYTNHFFFWRYAPNPDMLLKHFDDCIAPLLE
jgi:hypothetical protein